MIRGVKSIHDLHVWSITSYVHVLSAHVVLDEKTMKDANHFLNKVKVILANEFRISHSTLQLEKEGYEEVGSVCFI